MNATYDELPAKPRPEPAPENAPYWAGLRAHRLVIQRCTGCGKLRHYPRPMCDACYAMTCDWCEVAPRGTVHSWTVSHHPFHPAFKRDVPYTTLTVDLDAGVRLQVPLADGDPATLAVGVPVTITFVDVDAGLTLPAARIGAS